MYDDDSEVRQRREQESDDLLEAANALNKDGVYAEQYLANRTAREILAGGLKPWSEESMIFADFPQHDARVTFDELLSHAHATSKQRRYYRLIKRLGRYSAVAEECGVQERTVRQTLARMFLRVHAAYPAVAEAEPSDWARRLFEEEMRSKFQQIYHAPSRQKASAYRHDRSRQEVAIRRARSKKNRP